MRVVITVIVLAFVVLASGWSLTASATRAALPAPPRCTTADTSQGVLLFVGGGEQDSPLYMRPCGPGRGVIHANGKTYTIHGGFCGKSWGHDMEIRIGMATNLPAAPGRAIWLRVPYQSGPTTISDSDFEFPHDVGGVGNVVVGAGLNHGTFSLHSWGATATTGIHFTGSWVCGSTVGGLRGDRSPVWVG